MMYEAAHQRGFAPALGWLQMSEGLLTRAPIETFLSLGVLYTYISRV